MEIIWYGEGCVRFRGREGTVVADAFRSVLGPTGRGVTADIATFSHLEPGAEPARSGDGEGPPVVPPASLQNAFVLHGPGEYEVHDVLVTGVRTYRDDALGAQRGENVCFVYELEGIHAAHLGDIGHLLNEDMLGEIGTTDIVCVPVGGALNPARAAELVAQLDARLVVPLPLHEGPTEGGVLARFLHEMGVSEAVPQPRLVVSPSTIPDETTLVLLEPRGRS